MKICVTGSTGFVGQGVVPALLDVGFTVNALVRSTSVSKIPTDQKCKAITGEALDCESVVKALAGCDALVHLVGARRKQLKALGLTYEDVDVGSVRVALDAMRVCEVRRIILLSAGAIGDSEYVRSKAKVEQLVTSAEVDWTIFRPSFILGPGQEWPIIMSPFLAALSLFPGHIGNVAGRAKNIRREDLAHAIVSSLRSEDSMGKIFEVPEIRKLGKVSNRDPR